MFTQNKMPWFNRRFAARPRKPAIEDRLFSLDGRHYVALDPPDVSVLLLLTYPLGHAIMHSY